MNERVIQFRVGVVVVAAAIITGILIMLFGEGRTFVRRQYTIVLHFERAPGVTVDTPVRKHGVLIGRVSSVELDDEAGGVRITARIDANRKLYTNEVCVIKTSSLLGDAVLEFVPSSDDTTRGELVRDNDVLADGKVASDPLEVLTNLEGDVRSAIGSIESAARQVDALAGGLNEALGTSDDQLQRILQKSELALDTFNRTMTTIDEVIGDDELRASLKQSLQELPQTLTEMRTTLATAGETLEGFQRMSQKAERNFDNLERFTGPLGERGEDLVANIDATMESLDEILGELVVFSRALNSREGSLGQFIHNRQLFDRLNGSAQRIEQASRRIEPIMQNVRTLTDKLARDPRLLGVKGALDRRPLGMGLNTAPLPERQTHYGEQVVQPNWPR